MNLFLKAGAVAAVIAVAVVVGVSFLPRTLTPGASGGEPVGPVKGHVEYPIDGEPATIDIDAMADASVLTGTAELSYWKGDATIELQCLVHSGKRWALGGKYTETTTGTNVGDVMAIYVEEGSPQRVLLLEDEPGVTDCQQLLAVFPIDGIPADQFTPVDAGGITLPTTP
jgi:hypothetical protein